MKTKKLVLVALFIALSFIGANIRIMGSIAFDSMPGFLGAIILGPVYGAIIGAVGHILTAALSGFPYTLPVHIITMFTMGLTMFAFGFTYKKLDFYKTSKAVQIILSSLVGVIINGPLALLLVAPLLGFNVAVSMIPVLSGVAALNVILAFVVYKALPIKYTHL